MSGYFGQAGIFLVETLFGLYILAVLLRFLFQIVRADFYNPVARFVVTATNPLLRPLRRLIPGLGGIDLASVVLVLVLECVKIYLVWAMLGRLPQPLGVLVLAIGQLLEMTVYVFIVVLVVRVILSWVSPYGPHPAFGLLVRLSEPLMRPARRLIPAISGLDLSPIAVFIVLGLVLKLGVQPILDLGVWLAR